METGLAFPPPPRRMVLALLHLQTTPATNLSLGVHSTQSSSSQDRESSRWERTSSHSPGVDPRSPDLALTHTTRQETAQSCQV